MARMRPVSHEDRLTLVEHLDELRTRIVVCLLVFGVALALCFWQNELLLEIASGPLPSDHKKLLTLGVAEPFTTTLTVATYGALILGRAEAYSLPLGMPDVTALTRGRAKRPSDSTPLWRARCAFSARQRSQKNTPSVDTSNPAMDGQVKTGHLGTSARRVPGHQAAP